MTTAPSISTWTGTSRRDSTPMPHHWTGGEHMASQPPSEHGLSVSRCTQQSVDRHAGVDLHLVEHRDQVLAGDIPRGALRHRAPAQLTEARLEAVDSGLEGAEDVGQALPSGVVEVRGELDPGQALARLLEELPYLAGVGHARGV